MANKIFISYKYHDSNVYPLKSRLEEMVDKTTVRSYVDLLESYFDDRTDYIYKGESDDEDLSDLSDEEIWERLKDRIYDSTVTIVMISQNMKESHRYDKSQWIPWEISYSLKETTRNDKTSHSNAILAIVLPDKNNSYDYFIHDNGCCGSGCRTLKTGTLFKILSGNMFNQRNKAKMHCDDGRAIYTGKCSYIDSVKWENFSKRPQFYVDNAIDIKSHINDYDIVKEV